VQHACWIERRYKAPSDRANGFSCAEGSFFEPTIWSQGGSNIIRRFAYLLAFTFVPLTAQAQSFNCKTADRPDEVLI
jgi:hypothetical protein